MSGGRFDYDQYRIRTIWETIQSYLDRQGKKSNETWDGEYNYPIYPEEVQKELKRGIEILKKAEIYAQRIDWFLSDDDGDEAFLTRLKKDLSKTLDND